MATLTRCECGSPYTRTIAGVRVCDTCAWLAEARASVMHAETLRELFSRIDGRQAAPVRNALINGATQLERHAANIEAIAKKMRGHRGPR